MVTKEQCEKALNDYDFVKECVEDLPCGLDGVELNCDSDELYDILNSLIKEHFSNPPLTFEELKEDMWVWDNKEKMYIHSVNNYDSEVYGKGIRVQIGFDLVRYQFEPNRFYRKEVQKEND